MLKLRFYEDDELWTLLDMAIEDSEYLEYDTKEYKQNVSLRQAISKELDHRGH